MTSLTLAKFLSWDGNSGSARNSSMPRETWTAPATLPLAATSVPSRTSTTSVLPLAIISFACAGVIFGTAALAASIICLTLVVMVFPSLFVLPWSQDYLVSDGCTIWHGRVAFVQSLDKITFFKIG